MECSRTPLGPLLTVLFGALKAVLSGAMLLATSSIGLLHAAETSVTGEAAANYKFDDNINVAPSNEISLAGLIVDGSIRGQYATARLKTSATLALSFERYQHAAIDSDNVNLADPDASAFNSDNQDLSANISYSWEHHTLGLSGLYSRDSTLNTQFLDTGGGGPREIAGTSRRTLATLTPTWLWKLTERQTLNTSITGQQVEYESDRYINYDFVSANTTWMYLMTERFSLQLQPVFSRYENEAIISVKSNTYGLQAGFLWALAEKWSLNVLAGSTQVHSVYGSGLIPDQDNTSFIGNGTLKFDEERWGLTANLFSQVSPNGNGNLRRNYGGRLSYKWKPLERMEVNMDTRVGQDQSSDDRFKNKRNYGEVGGRIAYQFAKEWWLSVRYRYREQQYENVVISLIDIDDRIIESEVVTQETGRGNSAFLTLSYRLPKEIL